MVHKLWTIRYGPLIMVVGKKTNHFGLWLKRRCKKWVTPYGSYSINYHTINSIFNQITKNIYFIILFYFRPNSSIWIQTTRTGLQDNESGFTICCQCLSKRFRFDFKYSLTARILIGSLRPYMHLVRFHVPGGKQSLLQLSMRMRPFHVLYIHAELTLIHFRGFL